MENENNVNNNNNNVNADANDNAGNDRNENIINIINNNYPGAGNPHPIQYQGGFPLPFDNVLRNEMLRMLHELRVPLYALGALGGGGGAGAADDDMEQAAVAVLARSLYDARPVKHVIDIPEGESSEQHGIREMAYDPETAEELKINTTCGIWQEEFEAGEAIKILPCNHAFKAEAITTWLTTEKAECPICRFKLKSKEVIMHPPASEVRAHFNGNAYVYDDNVDDDVDDDDLHNAPQPQDQPQPQPQPPVDEQRARENNIMYRQNNIIYYRAHRGGIADMGRDVYHGMSMPMSQLIQMRGRLVHGGRAAAAGSSGGVAAAAAIPLSQPSQVSQPPQPSVTNINNYYINRIMNYQISAEEQEEADIEEAIRRSLE
jgi:hypothetical protein